jgi:hypothetical protein
MTSPVPQGAGRLDDRCTECGRRAAMLWTASWGRETGDLIRPGEKLCAPCKRKRGGRTLREINAAYARHGTPRGES